MPKAPIRILFAGDDSAQRMGDAVFNSGLQCWLIGDLEECFVFTEGD